MGTIAFNFYIHTAPPPELTFLGGGEFCSNAPKGTGRTEMGGEGSRGLLGEAINKKQEKKYVKKYRAPL